MKFEIRSGLDNVWEVWASIDDDEPQLVYKHWSLAECDAFIKEKSR